jgi:hypothetical protein
VPPPPIPNDWRSRRSDRRHLGSQDASFV